MFIYIYIYIFIYLFNTYKQIHIMDMYLYILVFVYVRIRTLSIVTMVCGPWTLFGAMFNPYGWDDIHFVLSVLGEHSRMANA